MTDDEQTHVDRIIERLRKDHPDPKMRDNIDWIDYVRVLMPDGGNDDELVSRIADAVRAGTAND